MFNSYDINISAIFIFGTHITANIADKSSYIMIKFTESTQICGHRRRYVFKHSDHKGDRGKTLVTNNKHKLTDVSFDSNFYYLKKSI